MSGIQDWNPGTYERFRGLRLRPALDLLNAVPPLPKGAVVDLGCGSGSVAAALRARFPDRALLGVDASPAMLAKARDGGAYDALEEADIATWSPHTPPALIFSNAALHWLSDHKGLLPRLMAELAPGGALAIQMPGQNEAPSHRLWLDLMVQMFPQRAPTDVPGIAGMQDYAALLPQADLWETIYHLRLPAAEDGHPVRLFSQSTFARPFLAALTEAEQAELIAEYDRRIHEHYPLHADASVLLPFRRVFIVAVRAEAR